MSRLLPGIACALLVQTSASFANVRVFVTSRDGGERLTEKEPEQLLKKSDLGLPSVFVDPAKRFQTIEGIGGAFTEASAVTLRKMSPDNQQLILKAYFDAKSGNAYSLCRTHINSCDFAMGNYAYSETPNDKDLAHFSIERDRQALIPMIQAALKISQTPFKLFASPWSPPAWMKTNGEMNNGGSLKAECRDAWARYYVRYIQEYQKEGIPIWALTVQNEPAAQQRWDSCLYSAEEERDFVRDHLGPTLEKAGLGQVKLMIWDHNRDLIVERAAVAYADPKASKYIWGTAYHWYGDDKFENLQLHHDAWPDKKLFFSEGCQESGPHTGDWKMGERYGRSIISDFSRWAVAWTDWNLLLDETGGPNHVNNLCSAPILADTEHDRILFQSSYYYIGHFSRFVKPGAQRLLCATNRENLEATAFANPDGSMAVVVLNRTDDALRFALNTPDSATPFKVPAHSISTYVITADK
ncbi:MAG: glycoside hydrolase family 30 beta sandwich domain-containing protein [Chthoniobacteraceae bacterium]